MDKNIKAGALPAPATAGAILSCFWPFLCARPELFFLFPVRASVLHQDHRASRTRCLWPQCAAAWDFRPSYRNHGQSRQALTIRPMPGHSAAVFTGHSANGTVGNIAVQFGQFPALRAIRGPGQVKLPTQAHRISFFGLPVRLFWQRSVCGQARDAKSGSQAHISVKNLP